MNYFSERENGLRPRIEEEISQSVWEGIVELIDTLVKNGSLGFKYPEICRDGSHVVGTDTLKISRLLKVEIPDLIWPLQTTVITDSTDDFTTYKDLFTPDTLVVLDLIEFCFRSVGKPIQGKEHAYWSHHHITFDQVAGQEEYRNDINRIFARNGIAYELDVRGHINRITTPILSDALSKFSFNNLENRLSELINDAIEKFKNPDIKTRREALEKLWDSWERLKTIKNSDKKIGLTTLLTEASPEKSFRGILDLEARKLTDIGNEFQIRHHETKQKTIETSQQIDYLFHRLFSLIQLLTRPR